MNEEALRIIAADRVRAHNIIFQHRHPLPTAPFQAEIIEAFHSSHPRVVIEAFRKAAWDTKADYTPDIYEHAIEALEKQAFKI